MYTTILYCPHIDWLPLLLLSVKSNNSANHCTQKWHFQNEFLPYQDLSHFLSETSAHGFSYWIGGSACKRAIWVLATVLALVFTGVYLSREEIINAHSSHRAWHYEWHCNRSWSLLLLSFPRTVELPITVARSVPSRTPWYFFVFQSLLLNGRKMWWPP